MITDRYEIPVFNGLALVLFLLLYDLEGLDDFSLSLYLILTSISLTLFIELFSLFRLRPVITLGRSWCGFGWFILPSTSWLRNPSRFSELFVRVESSKFWDVWLLCWLVLLLLFKVTVFMLDNASWVLVFATLVGIWFDNSGIDSPITSVINKSLPIYKIKQNKNEVKVNIFFLIFSMHIQIIYIYRKKNTKSDPKQRKLFYFCQKK